MRAALLALLLTPTLLLAACTIDDDDDSVGDDDDATEASFDPSGYEVVTWDLTDPVDHALIPTDEQTFQIARWRTDTPVRIVAIDAMFHVEQAGTGHVALYGDEGHNFYDFLRETPSAEFHVELTEDDHRRWITLELDEPIDLPFPQLVYAGQNHTGDPAQASLATDDVVTVDDYLAANAGENEQYPPHVVVWPDRGTDTGGFEQVAFAGGGIGSPLNGVGDLMVRLYVEPYDVVDSTWFADATNEADVAGSGLYGSSNVGFGDCNNDGWIDVWDGGLRVNAGDGTFVNGTDASGIAHGGAPAWGDYNNDGNVDLFLAGGDDRLYENQGDCLFVDVTPASGIDDTQLYRTGNDDVAIEQHAPTPSAAWVDVNGDGWLDLMQANFMDFTSGDSAIDYLWMGSESGVFTNATDDLDMEWPQGSGKASRGVAPADWDNDGDMDLFVNAYRLQKNYAWRNDGDTFTNIGEGILEGNPFEVGFQQYYYGHTIGAAWGDVDSDGDLDLFAANLAHPRFLDFSDLSMFLRNDGDGEFTEMREEAGMIYQETDSSPVFLDYDNDGDLDLFYTTVYAARPSYLYRNDGDWNFTMVSYPAGTWMFNGWGIAAADLDNDGDVDLYGRRLLRNEDGATGSSISVRAVGGGAGMTNVSAIGARVIADVDGVERLREVVGGVGVSSCNPLTQHVGLGDAAAADVRVVFPVSGTTVDVGSVPAGSRITVHEDGTIEGL